MFVNCICSKFIIICSCPVFYDHLSTGELMGHIWAPVQPWVSLLLSTHSSSLSFFIPASFYHLLSALLEDVFDIIFSVNIQFEALLSGFSHLSLTHLSFPWFICIPLLHTYFVPPHHKSPSCHKQTLCNALKEALFVFCCLFTLPIHILFG